MEYIFSDKVSELKASAIREILKYTSDPQVISFAAGNPAPESFPVGTITEISKEIFEENPILALQYSITEGYTPLRDALKAMLEKKGIFNPETDELIITSGAQQANELTAKVLCNEGDTIVCEQPSFIGSLNAFKSYNVNLVGVTLEDDGFNIDELEQTLKNNNTKIIYVIPNFQNPTGFTTSLEKRKQILELAQKYNAVVLEDNPYGYLRVEGEDVISIKQIEKEQGKSGNVMYSGTFSKILAPGIRVGYACGNKEIINKMVVCKQVSDVHTNIWAQVLTCKFLERVDFDQHIQSLQAIYRKKRDFMIENMQKYFSSSISYNIPEGGLFIWCSLPDGYDSMEFCNRAIKEKKVALVPGCSFLVDDTQKTGDFRINFSTPTDEQIEKGCKLIGELSKEMFGE